MAPMQMTREVFLRCGETEARIGEVTVPSVVTTGPADGDSIPFTIAADMTAFRASLAALLREAADAFENEGSNDEPDDGS